MKFFSYICKCVALDTGMCAMVIVYFCACAMSGNRKNVPNNANIDNIRFISVYV